MRLDRLLLALLFSPLMLSAWPVAAQDAPADPAAQERDFEQHIRPLLARRCFFCHGPEKQQGDIRLDQRQVVLGEKPGDGLAVPGSPDQSRLVQVIRYSPDDTRMPPSGKLPDEEIALLTRWIESGAFWPETADGKPVSADAFPHTADGKLDFRAVVEGHWAFQPIKAPPAPKVQNPAAVQTPVDRFVLAKLDAAGLTYSPTADRRTLARRLWFDLLGVPPTYEEVEAFAADSAPDAVDQLIERLLASPLYGQRWGRHWLDIARYADTKGYVFTDNRFYPFSFTYRDYVVDSLNADKPYSEFVAEQIAADRLGKADGDPSLAALGFLTVGRRYLNNQQDIIDDRIDVVSRGLLGLSVSCARCHDHKFDPIPTADYYSLYGVFASCREPDELPMIGAPSDIAAGKAYYEELARREAAVQDYINTTYNELFGQMRSRSGDYLLAVLKELKKIPEGTAVTYAHGEPRDRLLNQWKKFLEGRPADDAVFRAWKTLVETPEADFPTRISSLLAEGAPLNRRIREAFEATPPKSLIELAGLYGRVFTAVDSEWQAATANGAAPAALPDADSEQVRRALYGEGSVTDVPRGGDRGERLFERDHRNRVRELKKLVADWNVESAGAPPRAMVLVDNDQPTEPVVFVRGNPGRPGEQVPRRFLQVLSPDGQKFQEGSGRLELARAITSPENPLTARVIVNRVWMWHFGTPLVASPSDFGFRSDAPSNPGLLDYLASRLVASGWSLKELHREILRSAAWQQQSLDRAEARAVDAENQLYWRMNRRRREFESQRDAWLAASGRLDNSLGGKPVNIETQPFSTRRTVYGLVDRNNLPGLLRTFDFPTPDVSAAQRPQTTVPQQALFGMNSPFVQEMAAALAARTGGEADPSVRIGALFELALSRRPTDDEVEGLVEAVQSGGLNWADLAQVLLMSNEFAFVD